MNWQILDPENIYQKVRLYNYVCIFVRAGNKWKVSTDFNRCFMSICKKNISAAAEEQANVSKTIYKNVRMLKTLEIF